jgi:hypothetical protein
MSTERIYAKVRKEINRTKWGRHFLKSLYLKITYLRDSLPQSLSLPSLPAMPYHWAGVNPYNSYTASSIWRFIMEM